MHAKSIPSVAERAWRYIEKMPPSIQGSGGRTALFNVAVVLVRRFAMELADAWPLLLRWNQSHCQPPWSESELRVKLNEGSKSHLPVGDFLERNDDTHRNLSQGGREAETRDKATKRQSWPAFYPLTGADMEAIARLRRIPVTAVVAAAHWGFLSQMSYRGHSCMVFHERNFAQVRRLDGKRWMFSSGEEKKTLCLPGSEGAFFGQRWLGGPSVRVLLVEGVIGILEAYAAHDFVNPKDGWTILAATSAVSRFSRDPRLLQSLAGRRVRLVPDPNNAGLDGACSWLADLERVGCLVDSFRLPPGVEDLGSLVANAEANMETLNRLFS